jgi:hypothetical protein
VLNLDRVSIDIPCPGCGFFERATIRQIRLQDIIICGGCKANIHLRDQMAEVGKARRRIARQLNELASILAKPINITLRF